MRSFATLLWVFAVFSIGGCTQVTGPPPGEPVEMTITGWPGTPVPLEDVELCEATETGKAHCVTTDADGKAILRLPLGETSFTKEKESFASYLVPIVIPEGGLAHESAMGTDAFVETLHDDVMSPYPLGDMGRISIGVGFAGVTFDLSDLDGPVAAKRYYVDDEPTPTWSLDLTATTGSQGGGFLELSPGQYSVQFGGTAINCIPVPTGWPGLFIPNSIRLRVRAGYATQVTATCSPAP